VHSLAHIVSHPGAWKAADIEIEQDRIRPYVHVYGFVNFDAQIYDISNPAAPDMNWLSTASQVRWIVRDEATGKENEANDWNARRGALVKLRPVNDPKSFHPMQHSIHLHGQRMLVIARDGVPTRNQVWKDSALIPVGSTVDCRSMQATRGTGCCTATSPSISGRG